MIFFFERNKDAIFQSTNQSLFPKLKNFSVKLREFLKINKLRLI